MKKLIIPILLLLLIFLLSCEKDSIGPIGGGSIIGDWLESDAVISLVLTTNSPQTANNFLNSSGEIAINGDYNSKLKLMFYTNYEEDNILLVMNGLGFGFMSDTTMNLGLDISGDDDGVLLVEVNDDSEFEDELSNPVDFTLQNETLNINNSMLHSVDTGLDVNVVGTINVPMVSIPSNTPTVINFNSAHFYEFGNTVTTFREDSSFVSSEDLGESDTTGTWSIVGDTLKITTKQEVEDEETGDITTVDTTMTFSYINYGNQFIITQSFNICDLMQVDTEEDFDCTELYNIVEFLTHLDSNSIINADMNYQLFFEKIQDNQLVKSANSNNNIFLQIPNNIKEYLVKTRKYLSEFVEKI